MVETGSKILGEHVNAIYHSRNPSNRLENNPSYHMATKSHHIVVVNSVGFHKDIFGGNKCDCMEKIVCLVNWKNSHQVLERSKGRSGFGANWYCFAVLYCQGEVGVTQKTMRDYFKINNRFQNEVITKNQRITYIRGDKVIINGVAY